MTYHPGKVIKAISPDDKDVESSDDTVQATVEMWDENLFTFLVNDGLELEEGNIVLVDYRPIGEGKMPIANQKIVKVLKGETGEDLWSRYKEFKQDKRRKKSAQTSPLQQPSYMG